MIGVMIWDTIVIGGGFAGVRAAYTLEQRHPGARVLLLEAAPELGGRARSVATGDRCALDLGAHYFGADHRRVHELAARVAPGSVYSHIPCYGQEPASRTFLEGQWRALRRSDSFLDVQGLSKRVGWEHRVRMVESLFTYLALEARVDPHAPWATPGAAALDAMTMADWIAAQRVPRWIHEMWTLGVLNILSVHPRQISLLYWLWYTASNGGFLKIANDFVGGPQEFALDIGMQGLLLRHAAELRAETRRGAPVRAVDHHDEIVRVDIGEQAPLLARHVIVAVTPAAATRIAFTPALRPEHARLHGQPVGHAAKVILRYKAPWWTDSLGEHFNVYTAGAHATGLEWFLDTSHPDGRQHSLTGFVSDQLLDAAGPDPAARRAAVLAAAVELCGDPRAADPIQFELFDWRDHPSIGGGPNTCLGPGLLSTLRDVLTTPEGPHGRLHFAAAEYALEYTGYVEGALVSGEQVGARVAATLAGGTPLTRPHHLNLRPLQRLTTRVATRMLVAACLPATWAADLARSLRGSETTLDPEPTPELAAPTP